MKIEKLAEPPNRFQYDWDPIVEYGKSNPGEWFKPDVRFKFSMYGNLKRGKNRLFDPEEWEIRSTDNRPEIATGIRWCSLVFKYEPKREK